MSSVLTYKVEIKNNQFNTELCKYSSNWMKVYCKIQRQIWHRIKQLYMKYGSIDLKMMNSLTFELRSNYDLTSRCLDSIVNNMIGRYESLKEIKKTELIRIERKIEKTEAIIEQLKKDKIELQEKAKENKIDSEELKKLRNLKIKLHWKYDRLNKLKSKYNLIEDEILNNKLKLCFGTKELLKKNLSKFRNKRDNEIYFIGRSSDTTGNNNLQMKYNRRLNQFYLKVRKEIDLENGKYVYGKIYFNKDRSKIIKNILRRKDTALSYRIKKENNTFYLYLIFKVKHRSEDCITRNSNGVIGVDFNKGFVSVTETDKHGNMINTFNIDYRFKQGNKTKTDLEKIACELTKYCLDTGKDLVVEKLNFSKTKDSIIFGKGRKYNEMISSFPYRIFGNVIISRCIKNKIYLRQVNPAWTSYIGNIKFAPSKKLNIHSAASFVIARRGMFISDSLSEKRMKKIKKKRKKYEKRIEKLKRLNNKY